MADVSLKGFLGYIEGKYGSKKKKKKPDEEVLKSNLVKTPKSYDELHAKTLKLFPAPKKESRSAKKRTRGKKRPR